MTAPAPYKMEREQYKIGADGKPVLDKEVPELKASLDTIRRTAADLIVKIDEKIAEFTQNKDKNQFAEIDQWIEAHKDEFPFDNPGVNQPTGFIEITPPVDMNCLKAESKKLRNANL